MNCAREDCGHAESLHSSATSPGELPGDCWACRCPAFTVLPAKMPGHEDDTLDFDRSDTDPERTKP